MLESDALLLQPRYERIDGGVDAGIAGVCIGSEGECGRLDNTDVDGALLQHGQGGSEGSLGEPVITAQDDVAEIMG